ncbi:hypothetical protein B0H13DRAFT_2457997 [Mycena leptocephala]|nr:hypothetical protein B0H13DRAFT_2457997 [Mycena leptocephala]
MAALTESDSKGVSAAAALEHGPACPSSASSSPMSVIDSAPVSRASSPEMKGRNCAFSDTVFTSTMRSSSPQSLEPEANHHKLSPARVLYSSAKDFDPDLDPFSAHATTYYAPHMISATPPGPAGHADLVFMLKTQLVLQTDLRRQFETDLRARDELIKVLRKKLAEGELAATDQRTMLKQCKKKVEELERSCRHLEKEAEGSCQESMQRTRLVTSLPTPF